MEDKGGANNRRVRGWRREREMDGDEGLVRCKRRRMREI